MPSQPPYGMSSWKREREKRRGNTLEQGLQRDRKQRVGSSGREERRKGPKAEAAGTERRREEKDIHV